MSSIHATKETDGWWNKSRVIISVDIIIIFSRSEVIVPTVPNEESPSCQTGTEKDTNLIYMVRRRELP